MSVLYPLGWFLVALVPLVVALYFLKVRRRAATVPSLMFWARALEERRSTALFQKLRQWLSLLLHLLVLALLLLALLRPLAWENRRLERGRTVLVIDTSASMTAVDEVGGGSRMDAALEEATKLAGEVGGGRSLAVLAAGSEPALVVPFSEDSGLIRERLAGLEAALVPGNPEAAMAMAVDLLESTGGKDGAAAGKMIWLSDRSPPSLTAGLTAGLETEPTEEVSTPKVVWMAVGEDAAENVAITRFAALPLPGSPQTRELMLEVTNYGKEAVETSVELAMDGRVFDVWPVELEGGGTLRRFYPSMSSPTRFANSRGWLTATLAAEDAQAGDNVARAVIATSGLLRVLVLGEPDAFLMRALEADPTLRFELLDVDQFSPELASGFDVIVAGTAGPGLEDLVATGRPLFLVNRLPPGMRGEGVNAAPFFSRSDSDHPMLRGVRVAGLRIRESLQAERVLGGEENGWRVAVPAGHDEQALLVAAVNDATGARAAAWLFQPSSSELPLRVAFPLLVSNTLRWLVDGGVGRMPVALETGENWVLPDGWVAAGEPGEEGLRVLREDGVGEGPNWGSASPGFFAMRNSEGLVEWKAVNFRDEVASNLIRDDVESAVVAERITGAGSGVGFFEKAFSDAALWTWLAVAGFGLLLFEWWGFHRRRTE